MLRPSPTLARKDVELNERRRLIAMARPWLCAIMFTYGYWAGEHGTDAEIIRKFIVRLPTASVLPIYRSGDFGKSPFLGQLTGKAMPRPHLDPRLSRGYCPSKKMFHTRHSRSPPRLNEQVKCRFLALNDRYCGATECRLFGA